MKADRDYFEGMYSENDDPWSVRTRWYERRKMDLVLASLTKPLYRHVYEPACGTGELSARLAPRCGKLHASDSCERAVAVAGQRLGTYPNVQVVQEFLPGDWPGLADIDLIILSEFMFYLGQGANAGIAQRAAATLAPDGEVLLVHWRGEFGERETGTDALHAQFRADSGLHRNVRHEEDDFLLEVFSRRRASVAQREGIA